MLYDKDIRDPLFEFLEQRYGKARILEEKRTGSSVADVVMVTETSLYGIEIKSDADTYARLAKQTEDYDKFYDFNYVAVGSTHGAHISEHVPSHWGIITVEELPTGADFYVLREPVRNENCLMENKLSLLWRPELAHIQQLNDLPEYKYLSKSNVAKKILAKVSHGILQRQICEELLERDYTKIREIINEYRASIGKRKKRKTYRRKRKTGK